MRLRLSVWGSMKAERVVRDVKTILRMSSLSLKNVFSRTSIVGEPSAPVVSLTSYSKRVDLVFIAIESVAASRYKPSRIILWLDEDERLRNPPRSLRRLVRRGLEILPATNFGPHKKYFPYVQSIAKHQLPLVTCDDDTIYPVGWLESLAIAHEQEPADVICHRAHYVTLSSDGIQPYAAWQKAKPRVPSCRNFAVGVGGVLYPPEFLDHLRESGTGFLATAPRADDVWLHSNAVKEGLKVRLLDAFPVAEFLPIRGGRTPGLYETNVDSGGNDKQIQATYSSAAIAALAACP